MNGMMKKSVLITGGSRGIGAAAVRLFSERGWNVAFTFLRSEEEARALSRECGALAIRADGTDASAVSDAVEETVAFFGGLDALVNNVGVAEFKLFTDIDAAAWDAMMASNVSSAANAARAALPHMIRRKAGTVVNVSSMWGQVGASCEVHYSASKAALIGMTKALAKEVAPSGIRVNCVAPGVIETDMNRALSDDDRAALCEEIPLGRFGTPREVAESIFFLASDASAYVTGQVLGVSGGMVI